MVSARNVAETYQLSAEDVSLCVMPLFHVHGLVASTFATLAYRRNGHRAGAVQPALVLGDGAGSPGELVLSGADDSPGLVARTKPRRKTSRRRTPAIHTLLQRRLVTANDGRCGRAVWRSDTGSIRDDRSRASDGIQPASTRARKAGSVGCGTGVRFAILNEAGRDLETGVTGEVSIKGPNVFGGYEGNREGECRSFTDGWFRTGDQGYLDDEGYLRLTGRIKELINRGARRSRREKSTMCCSPTRRSMKQCALGYRIGSMAKRSPRPCAQKTRRPKRN